MRATIKKYEEGLFKILMIASALIIMGVLIFIIGTIVYKGLPSLTWDMVSKLPGGGFYLGKEGGVLNAIVGSLYIVAGSLVHTRGYVHQFLFAEKFYFCQYHAFHF
jgi:phosphate transport system permease protein